MFYVGKSWAAVKIIFKLSPKMYAYGINLNK